jgi:branched-chain amino acid transport system permease protein
MRNWKNVIYGLIILACITIPFYSGAYLLSVIGHILLFMVLALSWDMLLRSGQISFGVAGFFGVGAYGSLLATYYTGLNPLPSIILGGVIAGLVAMLIGLAVLQLRGMYFAIVTLALAEIFRVIVKNTPEQTGGPEGMILPSAIFEGDPTKTYWLILGLAILTIAISILFQRTRVHFAVTSIRNNEIVAKSNGINVFKYLVFLFAATSAIQGLAGGVYAQIYAFVSSEATFSLNFVLLPMAMALLGGIYTTWGPALGAILLGGVSEYLKLLIPYGHLLVYGLIIVLAILFMPKGIFGMIQSSLKTKKYSS